MALNAVQSPTTLPHLLNIHNGNRMDCYGEWDVVHPHISVCLAAFLPNEYKAN